MRVLILGSRRCVRESGQARICDGGRSGRGGRLNAHRELHGGGGEVEEVEWDWVADDDFDDGEQNSHLPAGEAQRCAEHRGRL